jgi:hypothetical protein
MAEQNQKEPLIAGSLLEEHRDEGLDMQHALQKGEAIAAGKTDKQNQIPKPKTQRSPFFTKLNLDARMMIYDYLYGRLPPLVHKQERYDKPGMILSCKQANLVSAKTDIFMYVET